MTEMIFSAEDVVVSKRADSGYDVYFLVCASWGAKYYVSYQAEVLSEADVRHLLRSIHYQLRVRFLSSKGIPAELPKDILPMLEPVVLDVAAAIVNKGYENEL